MYVWVYMNPCVPEKEVKVLAAQSCPTLCNPMNCNWNSLGKNTGVGSHSLLQGIFPTQGSNSCLLHCRHILYSLSHQGSLCTYISTYISEYIYIYTHIYTHTQIYVCIKIKGYNRDTKSLVIHYSNKSEWIPLVKWVTPIFWVPSAYNNYVYTIL